MMETLISYFLYRSSSDLPAGSAALKDLLSEARRINGNLGLTGYLHYEDGVFYQWLEGGADALAPIRAKIMADPRHNNIEVLDEGVTTERRFGRFTMGYSGKEDCSLFDFLAGANVPTADPRAFSRAVSQFMDAAIFGNC